MSAFITPTLVRRYLLATGFEDAATGALVRRGVGIVLFDGMLLGDIEHEIARIARAEDKRPHDLSARLGMLAAAEELLSERARIDASNPWMKTALEVLGYLAAKWITRAGLTPEAWEEAKGR